MFRFKKASSSAKASQPEKLPLSQVRIINFPKLKPKIIALGVSISLISGLFGFFAYRHHLKQDAASASGTDNDVLSMTECTDFLIENPPDDLLNKSLLNDERKANLQQKMLCYQAQLQKDALNATAYTNLGEASRRLGDPKTAAQYHQKALQLNPNLVQAKLGMVMVELDGGNFDLANQEIQNILSNQSNELVDFYQGVTLYYQKNLPLAEKAFQKATEDDPTNAAAAYNLGIILDEQGKLEEAKTEYEQAINLNPTIAVYHYKIGLILYKQDRKMEALDGYQQALDLNIDWVDALNNISLAMVEQGYQTEAILLLRKAIQQEDNNDLLYYNLGLVLFNQNEVDEALTAFENAIRLNPNLVEAHVGLGDIFRDSEKLDDAIAQYREAIRLNPYLAQAHEKLGLALEDAGETEEANSEYQKAAKLYPDDSENHHSLPYFLYQPLLRKSP